MILIQRGKEPGSLLKYRKVNPEANYDDLPPKERADIREQIWHEQRGLCAYCMRKISDARDVRIEHFHPRHPIDHEYNMKETLDFKWMLGVCYGNSMIPGIPEKNKTCDAHRGNKELTVNPFDVRSVRNIKYRADGSIYSKDTAVNRDVTETLNLNCVAISLPQTRKKVLDIAKKTIGDRCKGKSHDAYIREIEKMYADLTKKRNLTPYCGIIISWLEDKLKIS